MTTNETCPKCGGKLVEKEGKFGNFLSCSNFPKCRFSKDVEDGKDYGNCPNVVENYLKNPINMVHF